MKRKKILILACAGLLALNLAACGNTSSSQTAQISSPAGKTSSAPKESSAVEKEIALRIGKDGKFTDYTVPYGGQLNDAGVVPPEEVISAIAELTGWNLDLADSITDGKGGMTVSLSDNCAIFTGPPSTQKDEFRVYGVEQLAPMVLDSIRESLAANYGGAAGLDVYFCSAQGGDLEIPSLGVTISSTEPYTQFPSLNDGGSSTDNTPQEESSEEETSIQEEGQEPAQEDSVTYTMYIGSIGHGVGYDMTYDGPLNDVGLVPPEQIIAAMAELTGWNLDLADQVYSGKGGMTVLLADSCSVFTGPSDTQNDEFHAFGPEDLAGKILGSIQQTFSVYYGGPNGLDVYFGNSAGESFEIPNTGITVSAYDPFTGL